MARPQMTFQKRQREQARREKAQLKAEKRAQRGEGGEKKGPEIDDVVIAETALDPEIDPTR